MSTVDSEVYEIYCEPDYETVCKDRALVVYADYFDWRVELEEQIVREFARGSLDVDRTDYDDWDHARYFEFKSKVDRDRAINVLQPLIDEFRTLAGDYEIGREGDNELRIATSMLRPVAQYLQRTPTIASFG